MKLTSDQKKDIKEQQNQKILQKEKFLEFEKIFCSASVQLALFESSIIWEMTPIVQSARVS